LAKVALESGAIAFQPRRGLTFYVSLAVKSLMQTLAKDDSSDMSTPRAALLKRLDEVATKDWLAALREAH
jgi:hypothetical protein